MKTWLTERLPDIDQNKVFLPALQRKFVWQKWQIELLFDSLMRNYPFGTFLFWRLPRQKAESYVFYEFLAEYDSRSPYNRRHTGAFLHPEIIGVLDGQQRLSSMYLGLAQGRGEARLWSKGAVERATAELRGIRPADAIDARRNWRDERLMALLAHRGSQSR